jgi:hypothetical protein
VTAAVQQEQIGMGLERLPFIGHSRKGCGVTKGRAGYVLRTWGLAGAGPRQDRVRAEHENELTELIEREPFIREREKTRKGSGRVVGADGDRTSSEKH